MCSYTFSGVIWHSPTDINSIQLHDSFVTDYIKKYRFTFTLTLHASTNRSKQNCENGTPPTHANTKHIQHTCEHQACPTHMRAPNTSNQCKHKTEQKIQKSCNNPLIIDPELKVDVVVKSIFSFNTFVDRVLLNTFQKRNVSSPAPVTIDSPSGDIACQRNKHSTFQTCTVNWKTNQFRFGFSWPKPNQYYGIKVNVLIKSSLITKWVEV